MMKRAEAYPPRLLLWLRLNPVRRWAKFQQQADAADAERVYIASGRRGRSYLAGARRIM